MEVAFLPQAGREPGDDTTVHAPGSDVSMELTGISAGLLDLFPGAAQAGAALPAAAQASAEEPAAFPAAAASPPLPMRREDAAAASPNNASPADGGLPLLQLTSPAASPGQRDLLGSPLDALAVVAASPQAVQQGRQLTSPPAHAAGESNLRQASPEPEAAAFLEDEPLQTPDCIEQKGKWGYIPGAEPTLEFKVSEQGAPDVSTACSFLQRTAHVDAVGCDAGRCCRTVAECRHALAGPCLLLVHSYG